MAKRKNTPAADVYQKLSPEQDAALNQQLEQMMLKERLQRRQQVRANSGPDPFDLYKQDLRTQEHVSAFDARLNSSRASARGAGTAGREALNINRAQGLADRRRVAALRDDVTSRITRMGTRDERLARMRDIRIGREAEDINRQFLGNINGANRSGAVLGASQDALNSFNSFNSGGGMNNTLDYFNQLGKHSTHELNRLKARQEIIEQTESGWFKGIRRRVGLSTIDHRFRRLENQMGVQHPMEVMSMNPRAYGGASPSMKASASAASEATATLGEAIARKSSFGARKLIGGGPLEGVGAFMAEPSMGALSKMFTSGKITMGNKVARAGLLGAAAMPALYAGRNVMSSVQDHHYGRAVGWAAAGAGSVYGMHKLAGHWMEGLAKTARAVH